MPALLLTSIDCTAHIHLIVGSNPLAAARCTRSLEVGAKPKVIAPADAEVHYGLEKRIEDGEVERIKRGFRDGDLRELGREDVEGVVDAVFVTIGARDPLSMFYSWPIYRA
jgi:uroporphyrin-III C-methyltransferase